MPQGKRLEKKRCKEREQRGLICKSCARGDEGDQEDQETRFEEMDAHQLAAKTAWVRFFLREASKRGYTIEDIVVLLDELE
jgi:hypothetical protein